LFDGILGKELFNLFNTIFFILYLCALTVITSKEKKNYYKIISIAFILSFLLFKAFKYNFLWLSGSLNYLWVATAIMFFLYIMEKTSVSKQSLFILLPFSFLCGWSHESFVVGIGASFFFYFLTHRDQLTKQKFYLLTAFYIGAIFLVLAPGSVNRALNGGPGISQDSVFTKFIHMRNVSMMYLLIIIIVIHYIFDKKKTCQWIKKEQILFIACLVSFCFVMLTGAYSEHSRFAVDFFSLIIILRSINWDRISPRIILIADIIVFFMACFICKYCYDSYLLNKHELSQIELVKRNQAEYIVTNQPDMPSWIRHLYALDYSEYTGSDIKLYGTTKMNLAKHYGVDSITFLPKDFVEDIRINQDKYSCFRSFGELPFYAKKIPFNEEYKGVTIEYKRPSFASWPESLHPILSRITGEHAQYSSCGFKTVKLHGQWYLLVDRSFPKNDKDLRKIVIQR